MAEAIVPSEVLRPGAVARSPFVESAQPRRRWFRRREALPAPVVNHEVLYFSQPGAATPTVLEAVGAAADSSVTVGGAGRKGFLADIPRGGANERNQGWSQMTGTTDRKTLLHQLQSLYSTCSVSSACVDTIARTCSAGGMDIVPEEETLEPSSQSAAPIHPPAPPGVEKARMLFSYVNPEQNFRQLMRQVFTDLCVYGDAFVEVIWAFSEPIALYNLPCADMLIDANEHGVVRKYVQKTDTNQRAEFAPNEVIHIKFDSPRNGLYGLGPTEKVVHNITTWIFTQGLLKSIMKKGNPPNVAFKWDLNLAEKQIQKFDEQYHSKNLGVENVGNPVNLIGDSNLHEFKPNQIAELLATLNRERDSLCTGYGVPPAKLAIIESGNIGGGTGTSQDKTFKVNTCGPFQELVLEAMTFAIVDQGFGVKGWRCKFQEIDWRDDEVIEKIRTSRVERGAWTPNRYRDEIGEPPVEGGDDAVFVLSRDVIPLRDISVKSLVALGLAPTSVPPTLGSELKLTPLAQAPGSQAALPPAPPAGVPEDALLLDLLVGRYLQEQKER